MWNLRPDERLRFWREFRESIDQKSLDQAIEDVNHLWSYAPMVNHYLTTDQIDEWPNPWELLYENHYCDLAKSLGIVYTLYLTKFKPNIEIRIYNEPSTKEQYNLVYVDDGKYVLNYIHDEIVNKTQLPSSLHLVKVIPSSTFELDKF